MGKKFLLVSQVFYPDEVSTARLFTGLCIEIGDNHYSKMYGTSITSQEILHFTEGNAKATIDCIICTQTLNFIYNVDSAIKGIYYLLKENGCVLATISGISQISEYDMERWGDYWRFTDKSARMAFSNVFGINNVEVKYYGNVLSAVAFLEGISSEELNENELQYIDKNYQLIITIKAIKRNA